MSSSAKRSRAAFETDNNGPPPHAPFALYGTPLPDYDADARDDGSYVPLWKQEVTDERGRKRLHGAFTGGWSAGYFNTVGSKDGWTPQTFVSSRGNRAKREKGKDGQRVEDFMDEEDLAEREEQMSLETQGSFAGLGGAESGDGRGKAMFGDLFRAEGETMGVKLLQKMGWRRGQGVGPKVRRRAAGDKTGETHLFAPENSKMISFDRKNDRKGLAFAGENRLGDAANVPPNDKDDDDNSDQDARILQTKHSRLTSKPKKLKKSGFGVGVLNDNGSDDEDPYTMGPQISYNRIVGGDKKKRKGGLTASNAGPNVQKPVLTSKKASQGTNALSISRGFRKCHDGRLPLDGFILATASLTLQDENNYPPPTVPENWTPAHLSKSDSQSSTYVSTADAAKSSSLDPKSRAAVLGETPLPGKSVFDFLSPAARDRLAAASGNVALPQGKGEGAPAGYVPPASEQRRTLWDLVPELERGTAEAALARASGGEGWMPYAEDEGKRTRYRAFLELKAGRRNENELPSRSAGMTVEEWGRELGEFKRAAEVFKPVSGLMASRFTSSASSRGPGLASDAPDTSAAAAKEEDPAEKAAKLGMFGPLTRSRQPFFPTRLLCKRFNVKPPANVSGDPGGGGGGEATSGGSKELVGPASLNRMMVDAGWNLAGGAKGFVSGGREGGDGEGAAGEEQRTRVEEVDAERNVALEGQRAGEALFRSIFGDDDGSGEE